MKVASKWLEEAGATAVEYSIMVLFIAIVILTTVRIVGLQLKPMFCQAVVGLAGTCP